MLEIGDQEPFFTSGTSPSQWIDGSDELDAAKDHQSLAEEAKGSWLEELSNVLWAYRTTARTSIRETPFRLTYGTEAVILVEVGVASMRRKAFNEDSNND